MGSPAEHKSFAYDGELTNGNHEMTEHMKKRKCMHLGVLAGFILGCPWYGKFYIADPNTAIKKHMTSGHLGK